MKGILISTLFLTLTFIAHAQPQAEKAIRSVLNDQITAWNSGDLTKFMKTYWNNDSLMFIGKSGITYGYTNTLANYKKSYPDTIAMGKLSFDIIQVKELSPEYYFVLGRYHLERTNGNLDGHYTLIFKKINGQWLIISDHSS